MNAASEQTSHKLSVLTRSRKLCQFDLYEFSARLLFFLGEHREESRPLDAGSGDEEEVSIVRRATILCLALSD